MYVLEYVHVYVLEYCNTETHEAVSSEESRAGGWVWLQRCTRWAWDRQKRLGKANDTTKAAATVQAAATVGRGSLTAIGVIDVEGVPNFLADAATKPGSRTRQQHERQWVGSKFCVVATYAHCWTAPCASCSCTERFLTVYTLSGCMCDSPAQIVAWRVGARA